MILVSRSDHDPMAAPGVIRRRLLSSWWRRGAVGSALNLLCLLLIIVVEVSSSDNFMTSPTGLGGSNHNFLETRIINGKIVTEPYKYPFMVSLSASDSGGADYHVCGGSLIAPDLFMTAAHCQIDGLKEIQLGRQDLSELEDSAADYESYIVRRDGMVPHPTYNPNATPLFSDFNDYMIVKVFGVSQVTPVRLNLDDPLTPRQKGQQLTVMGWGKVSAQGPESVNRLREVTLDYVTQSQCAESWSGVTDGFICAADFIEGEDSCTGDSGGPLIMENTIENIVGVLQVGLVSIGDVVCGSSKPGLYSRISHESDWIRRTVCHMSSDPPAYYNCPKQPTVSTANRVSVIVTIQMDASPTQTGWMIEATNPTNQVYAHRPIFTYKDTARNALVTERVQLDNNVEYMFTIMDRGGLGICCVNGDGYFQVQRADDGTVLVKKTFGRFQYSDSTRFSIGTPPSGLGLTMAPSSAPTVAETSIFDLQLNFDNDPSSISWYLERLVDNPSGPGTYGVPAYAVKYDGYPSGLANTARTTLKQFPNGKYRFTIKQRYGQGLCCANGIGLYKVLLGGVVTSEGFVVNSTVVFQGAEFDASASHEFTLPYVAAGDGDEDGGDAEGVGVGLGATSSASTYHNGWQSLFISSSTIVTLVSSMFVAWRFLL